MRVFHFLFRFLLLLQIFSLRFTGGAIPIKDLKVLPICLPFSIFRIIKALKCKISRVNSCVMRAECDQLLHFHVNLRWMSFWSVSKLGRFSLSLAPPLSLSLSHLFLVFSFFTGHRRYWENHEDSPEACWSLRAQNDQSSRVSCCCEDLNKNKLKCPALWNTQFEFRPRERQRKTLWVLYWARLVQHAEADIVWFLFSLRLLVKRIPHITPCLPDCMYLLKLFLRLWIIDMSQLH